MKINHNMSALVANNQLMRNENGLTASIERLSSGLRINSAADDAAGMAIATKMKAQIKGLNRASRNASDGVSVLETADGAMEEVVSMLQRMRELSVQAANGTNAVEDKEAIQKEIASLTEEIDRISRDTEFNTKNLLDGSLDQRVYTNTRSISRIQISDTVATQEYNFKVKQDARQAVLVSDDVIGTGAIPAGTVSINGVKVEVAAGENLQDVYEKLRKAGEQGEVNVFAVENIDNTSGTPENAGYEPDLFESGNRLVFVSDGYGSSQEMSITCDNTALADYLGITAEATVRGSDAKIEIGAPDFSSQATWLADGNVVTISDRNGFQISFEVEPGMAETAFTDTTVTESEAAPGTVLGPTAGASTDKDVLFDVTDIGTMTLQIGANEDQVMNVRIPAVSSKSLYIDQVNVCTVTGADRAITTYDKAISKVSETRSRIGAYENRLDHAIKSLDNTELNMTSALSRIEDVDMAEEMTTYTQYTVLSQAATSVLAQANDIPQQALQLLQ